jgi:hypothetical protein
MTEYCGHTFRTGTGVDRFNAIVAKACKNSFWIEIEAHDRSMVPFTRVFSVVFTSIEDRDRVRIAMRFVDENAGSIAPAPRLARA